MTRIGVLSDSHIDKPSALFRNHVRRAFDDCSVILHAGDLTDISILDVFQGKEVHGVHGNMCNLSSHRNLPTEKLITIDGFTIGLCHGAGNRHNIEDRMLHLFPTVDCIVYGHTHMAVNHRIGTILFLNPGPFSGTGRYGAPGSYGILTTTPEGLQATLHQLDRDET